MEQAEDIKRSVRTAVRSIEVAQGPVRLEESCRAMAAAIQQLAFALDKLTDLIIQGKSGENPN